MWHFRFSFSTRPKRTSPENPYAFATIVNPGTLEMYNLELEFDHSETDSELFDDMDMKLEAIASMSGMSGIFKLMAADVYKVKSLKPLGS